MVIFCKRTSDHNKKKSKLNPLCDHLIAQHVRGEILWDNNFAQTASLL